MDDRAQGDRSGIRHGPPLGWCDLRHDFVATLPAQHRVHHPRDLALSLLEHVPVRCSRSACCCQDTGLDVAHSRRPSSSPRGTTRRRVTWPGGWTAPTSRTATARSCAPAPRPTSPRRPTTTGAGVLIAFHVDRGQIDGVDVAGMTVGVFADTPPMMIEGNWRVGLFMDGKASEQQAAKLTGVFSGAMGGPMAGLAPLIGEFLGVETAPIEYTGDGRHHSVKIGDRVDITVEDIVSPLAPDGPSPQLTGPASPGQLDADRGEGDDIPDLGLRSRSVERGQERILRSLHVERLTGGRSLWRLTPQASILLIVAAIAWVAIIVWSQGMGTMSGDMGLELPAFLVAWTVMMAAMMLPSVAPVASLYSRSIVRHARSPPYPVHQRLPCGLGRRRRPCLRARGRSSPTWRRRTPPSGPLAGVTAYIACGVYQLSPLKYRCLPALPITALPVLPLLLVPRSTAGPPGRHPSRRLLPGLLLGLDGGPARARGDEHRADDRPGGGRPHRETVVEGRGVLPHRGSGVPGPGGRNVWYPGLAPGFQPAMASGMSAMPSADAARDGQRCRRPCPGCQRCRRPCPGRQRCLRRCRRCSRPHSDSNTLEASRLYLPAENRIHHPRDLTLPCLQHVAIRVGGQRDRGMPELRQPRHASPLAPVAFTRSGGRPLDGLVACGISLAGRVYRVEGAGTLGIADARAFHDEVTRHWVHGP